MTTVSFTGRPPLLSLRYTSTPVPLDIGDEVLFSDAATLAQSVQHLDENGWNTRGEFSSSTFIRARALMAFIREEIIEIALGHGHEAPIGTLL